MTFLVERLADLRRHLEHLDRLRPTVSSAEDLRRNLSLHNDVLFSLLTVCQLVIDVAGELAGRRGDRYLDWNTRRVEFAGTAPSEILTDVRERLRVLLGL